MSDSLDAYRDKRDFAKTPEPPPEFDSASEGRWRFVIHRHDASRLHYDLRLEVNGVLKSWAIPRGFTYDPKQKRMAVRTEDHPLAYLRFDGIIPKGEYGAGSMTIWDTGTFGLARGSNVDKEILGGELKLLFYGHRIRGEWHLIQTRKSPEWLMFKSKDSYAMREGDSEFRLALEGAPSARFPRRLKSMEVGAFRNEPFEDDAWQFELEFKGMRCQVFLEGSSVRWIRRGRRLEDCALSVLDESLERVKGENVLLDGILVSLDELGRPSEEPLSMGESLAFYAFDLMFYDTFDVRKWPLRRRKTLLEGILPKDSRILFVSHIDSDGHGLSRAISEGALGGMIAKRIESEYRPGPSESWCRISVNEKGNGSEKKSLKDVLGVEGNRQSKKPHGRSTNLSKIYWPEQGFTKGDLLDYYDSVSDLLLPYLKERPLHLFRFPDGILGKSFYQKDAPDHLPEWIETETIRSESGDKAIRYVICNDRRTLIALANMGSIDLHPWSSRRGAKETPTWAILDLDPKGAPFSHVVRLARSAGKILKGVGLEPHVKTSGASGLHVYVGLKPDYTYEQVRLFSEAVARLILREHREIATVERSLRHRSGRVYLDFLQNRKGQTVAPPYVVRPVAAASVSTPLDWDELSGSLDPSVFTLKSVIDRFVRFGDLFSSVREESGDLTRAISSLEELYL